MSELNEMETTKIPKLLLKFSLPAIVGMLVSALYNIVDSAFVGRGAGTGREKRRRCREDYW